VGSLIGQWRPAQKHCRLLEDGSIDLSFDPGSGTDFMVNAFSCRGTAGLFWVGIFGR